MSEVIYSKCGMRCDQCLIYRPNVEACDRRDEICKVFRKVWQGFSPDPNVIICDGCSAAEAGSTLFNPDCQTRQCVLGKGLDHCGYCTQYPCPSFPAEPTQEELIQKIDVQQLWTWEEEQLMQAYTCKKNMDAFRQKEKMH